MTKQEPEVMTGREAMSFLRISKPTLYRLIREGQIRGRKVGKNYRFLKSDLVDFVRGVERK